MICPPRSASRRATGGLDHSESSASMSIAEAMMKGLQQRAHGGQQTAGTWRVLRLRLPCVRGLVHVLDTAHHLRALVRLGNEEQRHHPALHWLLWTARAGLAGSAAGSYGAEEGDHAGDILELAGALLRLALVAVPVRAHARGALGTQGGNKGDTRPPRGLQPAAFGARVRRGEKPNNPNFATNLHSCQEAHYRVPPSDSRPCRSASRAPGKIRSGATRNGSRSEMH